MSRKLYLLLLVFWGGFVTLGAELTASRLLAPYFGTSLIVWSSLIGLILVALAVGYWLGGRWADRSPSLSTLLFITLLSGVMLSAVPLVSRPILGLALEGFARFEFGMLLGSFAGIMVLLGPPMVFQGCITPFAVRLAVTDLENTGRVAGRLFALGTLGSFIGAFVPTIFFVPVLGTRWTFTVFGAAMLFITLVGQLLERRWKHAGVAAALLVLSLAAGYAATGSPVKPGDGLVFEAESPYQYVRVVQKKTGWRVLELNEGVVVHSKYHPDKPLSFGEWDFVALAPYFNPSPYHPIHQAKRWAVIGAGAGTTARLADRLYNPDIIDGVEIDPVVAAVGEEFFDAKMDNYRVAVNDGRAWLTLNEEKYDVITIDAYRQPYIPFELSTVEFFTQVREHLKDTGAVAINVSRPPGDLRLVNALATTMQQVFPSIFFIHLPERSLATIIVGTTRPSTLEDFKKNGSRAGRLGQRLLARARRLVADSFEPSIVLTDDRAPVERLMDLMVAAQVFAGYKPPRTR